MIPISRAIMIATLCVFVISGDEITAASAITSDTTPSPDFDGDGTVGFRDLLIFAGAFGSSRGDSQYEARFDLNGDGSVGFADLLIFAGAFGSTVTVRSISVEIDVEEFTVGQTAALTATATWTDGRRTPVTEGKWASSDPEIATIETTDEGVLLRALSDGSVTVSVNADGQRGTLSVNILPLLNINGTLFVDPDIVTPEDPSLFAGVSYAGREKRRMFDRRVDDWVELEPFLFDATYTDGFKVEIQVNPEFGTSAAAMVEAKRYGWLIGQMPRVLRGPDFQTVWIHKGLELWGGGNNNVLIHTGQAAEYERDGIIEEVFLHEGVHTSLDAYHKDSEAWLAAQEADGDFISAYARDFPNREDLAETFPTWFAVRFREDRISARLATTIRSRIPNRLAYLDAQDFDLRPLR